MAKIFFEITIVVGVIMDLITIFSNHEYKIIKENIQDLSDYGKISMWIPLIVMIIVTVIYGLMAWCLLIYYEQFVSFRLAFGWVILSWVSLLLDLAIEFQPQDKQILSWKGYKFLNRTIAVIEIGMLIYIGIVGWNY